MESKFYDYKGWKWRADYIRNVLVARIRLWKLAPSAEKLINELK